MLFSQKSAQSLLYFIYISQIVFLSDFTNSLLINLSDINFVFNYQRNNDVHKFFDFVTIYVSNLIELIKLCLFNHANENTTCFLISDCEFSYDNNFIQLDDQHNKVQYFISDLIDLINQSNLFYSLSAILSKFFYTVISQSNLISQSQYKTMTKKTEKDTVLKVIKKLIKHDLKYARRYRRLKKK